MHVHPSQWKKKNNNKKLCQSVVHCQVTVKGDPWAKQVILACNCTILIYRFEALLLHATSFAYLYVSVSVLFLPFKESTNVYALFFKWTPPLLVGQRPITINWSAKRHVSNVKMSLYTLKWKVQSSFSKTINGALFLHLFNTYVAPR